MSSPSRSPAVDPITLPVFPRPSAPTSLWLVTGGVSPEHDVSLSSAFTVLQQFETGRHRVRPVCIRRDGRWCPAPEYLEVPLSDDQVARLRGEFTAEQPHWECLPVSAALETLERERPELAVIIMHGPQGEDGRIQALFEAVGINYTGSGVVASALAMDKRHTQRVLREAGLPVAPFAVIAPGRWQSDPESVLEEAVGVAGFPCVVKPVAGGSSVGVTVVRERDELRAAVAAAFEQDPEAVLFEELIDGTEATCGVLEIPRESETEIVALAPTEIVPRQGTFFDYHCKYTVGASEEITPARVSQTLCDELRRLAVETHRIVGARGFSRTDFMVRGGRPFILEINTIPGLTPTSLLPQGAAAVGLDFADLLNVIVEGARTHPIMLASESHS